METVRRVGGMRATIVKRAKRKLEIALNFSKEASRKIIQLGFKYARVEYEKNKLRIKFSQREIEGGKKLYFNKTHWRIEVPLDWQQVLENFPNMSLIFWPPLWRRIGEVSLRGNEAIVVFFTQTSEREELVFSFQSEPIEECIFYFNLAHRFGFLDFKSKISKTLFSQRVRGAKISKQGKFLVFQLKKDCYFECKECPRLNCQPFYYRTVKNHVVRATISVYGFLKREGFLPEFLAKLNVAQRKGKVWMPNHKLLIIELPFLAGH